MNRIDASLAPDPVEAFSRWLSDFALCVERRDPDGTARLFAEEGHWKDLLALTWEHKTLSGREAIGHAFSRVLTHMSPRNFRLAVDRPMPVGRRRSGRSVLEGFFDFDTAVGACTAFARLLVTDQGALAWVLLTTLQELRGFEERTGSNRPDKAGRAEKIERHNWLDDRMAQQSFADRDPEVIVVGAGHSGLAAAARLTQLGVDTLVVEKQARVGDGWRNRYHSLTLHNDISANHLPYMPFPKTWPRWLSKDQLALWLEHYAQCMELNVWTSTELTSATYSEADRRWTVTLRRGDGSVEEKRCRHVVVATGISGSIPNQVAFPGADQFEGDILHSSRFGSSASYAGKNVIVVGTGSSGHDIAQDLVLNGAKSVSLLQRGPTCVISRDPGAIMIYAIYAGDQAVEDVDLVAAAVPYPLLEDAYRFITRKAAELDRDLLRGLNDRGMKTFFGDDGTGFQMMFMRGQGGYYIDVGCSQLIADGKIAIIQYDDTDRLVADGLRMKDGTVIPCDAMVLATGFKNMQENVRIMFGDAVADKVGKVWGFDDDWQMRAMWRRTGQDGLWITGGSLLDSRIFSRFMTLEIKADLEGILPAREALPLRGRKSSPNSH